MDDTVLYTRKRRDASGVRVTPPPPRLKLLVGSVGVSTSIIFASELEGAVGKSLPSTGAQYKQISGHKPTISSHLAPTRHWPVKVFFKNRVFFIK